MATIGLFGGSFNPVHNGHVALAEYLLANTGLQEVWMSVSPLNPLKDAADIAPDADRLAMLRIALEGKPGLEASDVELTLPKPSYTIDTLRHLSATFPQHTFRLIIGSDNWLIFDKWKDYQTIANDFNPIVYPRPGYPLNGQFQHLPHSIAAGAPTFDVSSTEIRKMIARGDAAVETLLPPGVLTYIATHQLYK